MKKGRALPIPVIDLFAGPGGLGEGFSSVVDEKGERVFKTILSIEKDKLAHKTLRMRAFYRRLLELYGKAPSEYIHYLENPTDDNRAKLIASNQKAWDEAGEEALCAELSISDNSHVKAARERLNQYGRKPNDPLVLIGGPPCQAYSLVGRARRTREKEKLENDVKQTLYKCYLSFINELKPTIFVMENVKGMLSARHDGEGIFERVSADMENAGYTLHSLVTNSPVKPQDYVVEAELFGIPQARHRVILLGIRKDLDACHPTLSKRDPITLGEVLVGIPKVRSGFSERNKGWRELNWAKYVDDAAKKLLETPEGKALETELNAVLSNNPPKKRSKNMLDKGENRYKDWYRNHLGRSRVIANHESRSHLKSDLDRYLFCAAFASANNTPAKLYDFPACLLPNHKNISGIETGIEINFSDRFRVQLKDRCSTTITSHIAKDGHYYIHPDPCQCRSLTVREAARLQTFPDDYIFEGTRTSQYSQVGNAVPPLLAQQIGQIVAAKLGVTTKGFFGIVEAN